MRFTRERCAFGLIVAACVALGASGCTRVTHASAPATPSAETTASPSSAVQSANSVDVAAAQEVVLTYIDALRSRDASTAASLMTSYRRGETRAKGWKADIGWWKSARVKAVMHRGRYLADERAFARLYAEHYGHQPYKMVVLNVSYSYGLGPGVPPGDTDFLVTRDSARAPWLVHEFGGTMRPQTAATLPPE